MILRSDHLLTLSYWYYWPKWGRRLNLHVSLLLPCTMERKQISYVGKRNMRVCVKKITELCVRFVLLTYSPPASLDSIRRCHKPTEQLEFSLNSTSFSFFHLINRNGHSYFTCNSPRNFPLINMGNSAGRLNLTFIISTCSKILTQVKILNQG